nr:NADH dehydrogenase subunit 2 [Anaplecta sp. 5 ZQW-2020]WAX39181.1 NADH dehydrogenase subunit 2 [Anaplecta sp. 5 ZQW-2020]
MKNNSTKLLMMFTLIGGLLISISSNSWLGVWLGLEINLLSFIPIMSSSEDMMTTEASMKYFIVQAMSSTILIFMIITISTMKNMNQELLKMMINIPLIIKVGSAPFHWWFPSVMEGLQWNNCFILLTVQKVAPLCLMSYTMTLNTMSSTVIASSLIVGSMGGYNQTSLRKIMTYSSINHLGWMIAATMISKLSMLIYLMIYSIMNLVITGMMGKMNLSHINQISPSISEAPMMKILMMSTMLSLGGLPPLIGFMPKWLIIMSMIENHMLMMLMLMVITSLATLYYYIRLLYSTLMIQDPKMKWYYYYPNKMMSKIYLMMVILIITGMITLLPLMSILY